MFLGVGGSYPLDEPVGRVLPVSPLVPLSSSSPASVWRGALNLLRDLPADAGGLGVAGYDALEVAGEAVGKLLLQLLLLLLADVLDVEERVLITHP